MVQMAKYCIPEMIKNEGRVAGSIVNMGSVAGLKGGTPNLLYPTSKGAVVNMTRAMAANHAGDRIRVNCVCPGKHACLTVPLLSTGSRDDELVHRWLILMPNRNGLHTHDVRRQERNVGC